MNHNNEQIYYYGYSYPNYVEYPCSLPPIIKKTEEPEESEPEESEPEEKKESKSKFILFPPITNFFIPRLPLSIIKKISYIKKNDKLPSIKKDNNLLLARRYKNLSIHTDYSILNEPPVCYFMPYSPRPTRFTQFKFSIAFPKIEKNSVTANIYLPKNPRY